MILIIASKKDNASMNMANRLLESYDFTRINDEYFYKNYKLRFINTLHIYTDLDDLNDIDSVIFLSKHSSAADIKSLTVHAIGNFRKAELGGHDNQIVCSDPERMSSSLRYIKNNYSDNYFEITFEATHHGPYIEKPSYFIEIGTTENEWNKDEILDLMAHSIIDNEIKNYGNFIGVGGGHYAPKISDYFFKNEINIGHIIPKYVHEYIEKQEIINAVKKTPNCKGFLMDNHGTKSRVKTFVNEISDSDGLEVIKI